MRVRFGLLAVLSAVPISLLAACSGDDEPKIPPLTSEPGDPRPGAAVSVSAPPKQGFAPRIVLFKYLRGVAIGDVKVCAYLSPEYERDVFGSAGGCATGLGQAKQSLRPQDITALRGVTVPAGEPGPGAGEFTVQFADLVWRGDPARPGGVLAARYVLRQTGKRWLISA